MDFFLSVVKFDPENAVVVHCGSVPGRGGRFLNAGSSGSSERHGLDALHPGEHQGLVMADQWSMERRGNWSQEHLLTSRQEGGLSVEIEHDSLGQTPGSLGSTELHTFVAQEMERLVGAPL